MLDYLFTIFIDSKFGRQTQLIWLREDKVGTAFLKKIWKERKMEEKQINVLGTCI